jgi:uncharacterized protein YlxP (DUF503 family)
MSTENSSQHAHESVTTPIEQRLVINNDMIQRAFDLLKSRCVSRSEEHFIISTETVDHSDLGEYIQVLLEQYKDAGEEVRYFIQQLMSNDEGQQYLKAIVAGTKHRFSVSVIVASRTKTDTADQHKILIATMKKSVEMSALWDLLVELFDIESGEENELEIIVKQLTDEENKKCLETMALHLLRDNIQIFLGNNVEGQSIENNSNGTAPIATSSSSI